jgi:hypothetical protein
MLLKHVSHVTGSPQQYVSKGTQLLHDPNQLVKKPFKTVLPAATLEDVVNPGSAIMISFI